jgi:hypothetical protein
MRPISRLASIAAPVVVTGSLIAVSLAGSPAGAPVTATAVTQTAMSSATSSAPLWSTQLFFDNNGTPWSEASFAALKADGLTTAEIDMPWNTIEPARGTFSFTELDQEMANAAAAGIKLVPIFWYSGWAGSPASWVTSHEVDSSGAQGTAPAWWDPVAEPAYLTYVTDTIKHIAGEAGYGGSVLDYGDLDAQWDDGNGNPGGWAQDDINEFRNVYLPDTYATISAFNSANGTSYTAFSQVPAATPGQPLADVYQQFRVWSVQTVYRQLTAQVRAVTSSTTAVLLLRRPHRQRRGLREHPGRVLQPGQAVHGHRHRGRGAVARPCAAVRQPGPRLRGAGRDGMDRAGRQHAASRAGGAVD